LIFGHEIIENAKSLDLEENPGLLGLVYDTLKE
jgi:hypothetical protein